MSVLLLGTVAQSGQAVLRAALGDSVDLVCGLATDPPDALAAKFQDAEILVCPAYRAAYPPAPNLKLLHAPNAGLDSIEFDALPEAVRVCNAFGHDLGIGEYVLSAMLKSVLDLDRMDRAFREGDWSDAPRMGAAPRGELSGQTVLCVGYGSIGQGVAVRAKAFGMKVDAVTRTPRDFKPAPDRIADFSRLGDLAADADFLLVACPLLPETEGLIGADVLARMKPTATVINVARGAIVDQKALYEALTAKRLGGAVLDTWYHYPTGEDDRVRPADYPFWELENVTMTPHNSGWTQGLIERRFTLVADNIRRVFAGEPLINQVHPLP